MRCGDRCCRPLLSHPQDRNVSGLLLFARGSSNANDLRVLIQAREQAANSHVFVSPFFLFTRTTSSHHDLDV